MLRAWWHELLKLREGAARGLGHAPRRPRGLHTYRPEFDVLEGRVTPSAVPAMHLPGAPAAATPAQAVTSLSIRLSSPANTVVDLFPGPAHNSLIARASHASLDGFLVIANRTNITLHVKAQGRGPKAFMGRLPGGDFLFLRPPAGNLRVVVTVSAANPVPVAFTGRG